MTDQDNVVVRMADRLDAESVINLLKQLNHESDYLAIDDNLNELTKEQEAVQLDLLNSSGKNIVLVAEINHELIGIVSIIELDELPDEGELGVAVLNDYQNMGLGTALVNSAIDWYYDYSLLKQLSLEVYNQNQRAIKLYQRLGFKMTEKDENKEKMILSK